MFFVRARRGEEFNDVCVPAHSAAKTCGTNLPGMRSRVLSAQRPGERQAVQDAAKDAARAAAREARYEAERLEAGLPGGEESSQA